MNRKSKTNVEVTVADLNREITDLRVGLNKTAAKLAECMVELEDERQLRRESDREVTRLNGEMATQLQYQTRAHETIELLVKKMPYGQEPPTQYVVTSQFADAPLRAIREGLRQRAVKEGR